MHKASYVFPKQDTTPLLQACYVDGDHKAEKVGITYLPATWYTAYGIRVGITYSVVRIHARFSYYCGWTCCGIISSVVSG